MEDVKLLKWVREMLPELDPIYADDAKYRLDLSYLVVVLPRTPARDSVI